MVCMLYHLVCSQSRSILARCSQRPLERNRFSFRRPADGAADGGGGGDSTAVQSGHGHYLSDPGPDSTTAAAAAAAAAAEMVLAVRGLSKLQVSLRSRLVEPERRVLVARTDSTITADNPGVVKTGSLPI